MAATSFDEPKLQAILENIARDEGFKQPKFAISKGNKPGENFIGRIYRAVITERDNSRSLSLIFKASPTSELRQRVLSSSVVFATESNVYQNILPTLNNLMKKHDIVTTPVFPGTPRCYAVHLADGLTRGDSDFLVLEDKVSTGFRIADRAGGLDAEHTRLVLEKLAFWHAVSLALYHKDQQAAEALRKDLPVKNLWFGNDKHPLLDELGAGFRASLKNLKAPYKKGHPVYERLEKTGEMFNAEYVRMQTIPPDLPGCINHGDCWNNNLLFQYDKDGKVRDVCMIDLQLSRVCSPAVDIHYFMYLCTTKEMRDAHYDSLMRSYHNKVTSILRELQCDPEKIMPWDLFQEHLRRYGLFGVMMALVALPVFMADSGDFNADDDSGDSQESVFSGTVTVTDPIKLEEIAKQMTDVVHDAVRLGQY